MTILYAEDFEDISRKETLGEVGRELYLGHFTPDNSCDAECGATGHCVGIVRKFFVIGPGGGVWGWRNYCTSMAEGPQRARHRLYIVGPTQLSLF